MIDIHRLIYLHGLESDSNSGKARQFREWFPGMLTPDFTGTLEERMTQLLPILGKEKDWTIIGSSFGGLMGAAFTCDHPTQVRKLILLAPALMLPPFASRIHSTTLRTIPKPVSVKTIVIHGTLDNVVPLEPVREIAQTFFTDLTYIVVEDDHRLHKSVQELDWIKILE
ncbi:MAG TPA: alpha/beta fold hydrolase [Anaerolineales bacterium]|nr:alpha/beta fold hydrolase [Anaerolineales bacterium]